MCGISNMCVYEVWYCVLCVWRIVIIIIGNYCVCVLAAYYCVCVCIVWNDVAINVMCVYYFDGIGIINDQYCKYYYWLVMAININMYYWWYYFSIVWM